MQDGDITVWDSLAIIEYLAERYPEKPLWSKPRAARVEAHSLAAEMHSGFIDEIDGSGFRLVLLKDNGERACSRRARDLV